MTTLENKTEAIDTAVEAAANPKIRRHPGALRLQCVAHVARHQPSAEVRWNGIEAAARHDSRAIGSSSRVMPVDLLADPRRLAGDIAIVSAVAHAGFNQFGAVEPERSRGSGEWFRS